MDMKASSRIDAHLVADSGLEAGWEVSSLEWVERLSEPYRVELSLAHLDHYAEARALLGTSLEVVLTWRDLREPVVGIVSEVREGTRHGRGSRAVLTLEPALAALRHRRDTRIFQAMTVPEILERVLGADLQPFGRSVSNELGRRYVAREYTVQYEETDFAFVHRLMEEEGIVYYFRHEGGTELMVLVDDRRQHPEIDSQTGGTLRFAEALSDAPDLDEGVRHFEPVSRMTGTAVSLRNFDWTHPSLPVAASVERQGEGSLLESYVVRAPVTMSNFGPNGYAETDVSVQSRLLWELSVRDASRAEAISTSPALRCGHRFTLEAHPRSERNRNYLVISVEHGLRTAESEEGEHLEYQNRFTCIDDDVQWRPDRTRDRPRIHGIQTATVVGPAGEEIHTDAHGRVKLQFHWDRLGRRDEHSSCWIRVAQSMGGPGWGFTFVPRIGQEVIVSFVNGDPDQPIVTGVVYNGENPPPLDLPADKTRMTIKSNSSPGGDGFNELRLEDKAGFEEVFLHAQKDWNTKVLNDLNRDVLHDETQHVENDRTRTVGVDETVTVGQNRTRSVGKNEKLTVGKNRTRKVAMMESVSVGAIQTIQVGGARNLMVGLARNATIGKNDILSVGRDRTVNIVNNYKITTGASETRTVGGDSTTRVHGTSSLRVTKDVNVASTEGSILLTSVAADVFVEAAGNVAVHGKVVTIAADTTLQLSCGGATITLSEGKIVISGDAVDVSGVAGVDVKGAVIKLNSD